MYVSNLLWIIGARTEDFAMKSSKTFFRADESSELAANCLQDPQFTGAPPNLNSCETTFVALASCSCRSCL